MSDVTEDSLKEMDLLVEEGVTSFKSFSGSRDQEFSTAVTD